MKRGNTTRGAGVGGGEEGGEGGTAGFAGTNPIKRKRAVTTGGNSSSNNNNNSNKKKYPRPQPPPSPSPSPSPSSSMLLAQPRPCLVQCLSYLDSESIRQVCLLSKEYHSIIHNDPGMANTWKRALEIRPSSKTEDKGRLDQFVDQLYHRQLYYRRDQLQMIQEIRIIDPHKFKYSNGGARKVIAILEKFQLSGIVSLRMVSSSTSILPKASFIFDIFHALLRILPIQNLRVVDLSNYIFYYGGPSRFWENCSALEQITYNNNHNASKALGIIGTEIKNCSSLTELNMDDSKFRSYRDGLFDIESSAVQIIGTEFKNCSRLTEIHMDDSMFVGYNDGLSDIENDEHSNTFIFWKCSSKVLRKVSIKNAMYHCNVIKPGGGYPGIQLIPVMLPLPQKALIKFVRSGPPSLRYFCSDLTPANKDMLRLERPDIVFS